MAGNNKVNLLGVLINKNGLKLPSDLNSHLVNKKPFLITFVNPHAYHIAKHHADYFNLLGKFDRVCCDGIGLVMASKLLLKIRVPRQAFDTTSLALPVLEWARDCNKSVFIIGGQAGIAEEAAKILSNQVRGLNIQGAFDGYGAGPSWARNAIANFPNSLVICGMGAPLQERFLDSLKETGWRGIGFTCGGFLDQLVEKIDYYPNFVNRLNLRFLYRLLKEPRRLGKRYLIEYQSFIFIFLKALLIR